MSDDLEVQLIELAFRERHGDAWERANRFLQKVMAEYKTAKKLRRFTVMAILAKRHRRVVRAIEQHGNNHFAAPGEGPTTENLAQKRARRDRGDPLRKLHKEGKITDDQLDWAREIAQTVYMATRNMGAKITTLPIASEFSESEMRERRMTAVEAAELQALMRHWVYLPWADRARPVVPLVLELALEGYSLKDVARRHHMRWGTALALVRNALQQYGEIRELYSKNIPTTRDPRPDAPRPPAVQYA